MLHDKILRQTKLSISHRYRSSFLLFHVENGTAQCEQENLKIHMESEHLNCIFHGSIRS